MDGPAARQAPLDSFLLEAWEGLAGLEESSAALGGAANEAAAASLALLGHRLRGAASLYGFHRLSTLWGELETLGNDLVAGEEPRGNARLVALSATLQALPTALEHIATRGAEDEASIATLIDQFRPATPQQQPPSPPQPSAPTAGLHQPSALDRALDRFHHEHADVLVYFGPEAEEHIQGLFETMASVDAEGPTEENLFRLFRLVHTLKGAALTVGCTPIGELAHRLEDLLVAVRERRIAFSDAVGRATRRGTDALRAMLDVASGSRVTAQAEYETAAQALEDLLGVDAKPDAKAAEPDAEAAKPSTEEETTSLPVAAAAEPPRRVRGPTIRVELDRMDAMLDLVGELVICRSRFERDLGVLEALGNQLQTGRQRMTQTTRDFETKYLNPSLAADAAREPVGDAAGGDERFGDFAELELDRYDDFNILARRVGEIASDLAQLQTDLTDLVGTFHGEVDVLRQLSRNLRDGISRARMVPVGQLFARSARTIEQTAEALDKPVDIELRGEAVEIDNAVIERITDPLMHLVRNAITHGIEEASVRMTRGKPPRGRIRLHAYPHGNFVHIEIEDDGAGIDRQKLRQAAAKLGLRSSEEMAALSDEETLELIFVPGLSTSTAVTTAAGRGIGMDVVRTSLARLNGDIEVLSPPEAGTRFILKLPLTLLITEVMMFRVGTQRFGLAASAIRSMRTVVETQIERSARGERLWIEKSGTDLLRLDRILDLDGEQTGATIPVIVVQSGGRAVALTVDELFGIEEVVVKGLGPFLAGASLFAGATVTAEGQVVLLLDPTTFSTARDAVTALADTRGTPGSQPPQQAEARALLLVDDSLSVRKIVGQMLTQAGFEVATAGDGLEALEALRARSFDALITDLEMPRMNGYELIETVRQAGTMRQLPVFVITTRAGAKHASMARRLGATGYFTKPIDEQALLAQLGTVLVAREAASRAAQPSSGGENG